MQAQLGRSSITMTVDVYGHLAPDRHDVANAVLAVAQKGAAARR